MVLRVTHLISPHQCAILTNENWMVTVLLLLKSMQKRRTWFKRAEILARIVITHCFMIVEQF
jgi:hypothetical protein